MAKSTLTHWRRLQYLQASNRALPPHASPRPLRDRSGDAKTGAMLLCSRTFRRSSEEDAKGDGGDYHHDDKNHPITMIFQEKNAAAAKQRGKTGGHTTPGLKSGEAGQVEAGYGVFESCDHDIACSISIGTSISLCFYVFGLCVCVCVCLCLCLWVFVSVCVVYLL